MLETRRVVYGGSLFLIWGRSVGYFVYLICVVYICAFVITNHRQSTYFRPKENDRKGALRLREGCNFYTRTFTICEPLLFLACEITCPPILKPAFSHATSNRLSLCVCVRNTFEGRRTACGPSVTKRIDGLNWREGNNGT